MNFLCVNSEIPYFLYLSCDISDKISCNNSGDISLRLPSWFGWAVSIYQVQKKQDKVLIRSHLLLRFIWTNQLKNISNRSLEYISCLFKFNTKRWIRFQKLTLFKLIMMMWYLTEMHQSAHSIYFSNLFRQIHKTKLKMNHSFYLIPPHRIVSMVVDKFSVGFQPSARIRELWSRWVPTKLPPQELASNSTI